MKLAVPQSPGNAGQPVLVIVPGPDKVGVGPESCDPAALPLNVAGRIVMGPACAVAHKAAAKMNNADRCREKLEIVL